MAADSHSIESGVGEIRRREANAGLANFIAGQGRRDEGCR
jgi:hypothetical protein